MLLKYDNYMTATLQPYTWGEINDENNMLLLHFADFIKEGERAKRWLSYDSKKSGHYSPFIDMMTQSW